MKTYTGIDCGLSGGIVTIDQDGKILQKRTMPAIKAGKGRKIDLHALNLALAGSRGENAFVMIENPGGHAPSAAGLRSMTYSFAAVEALCVANGLKYGESLSQRWQKEFWSRPKMAKGTKFDTKAAALSAARKLWPIADWTATERSVKPHDGIVDAALIAEYARRNNY